MSSESKREGTMMDKHYCLICLVALEEGDECATDIELGTCHATCLEGSPIVDLDSGEEVEGPIRTFRYEA